MTEAERELLLAVARAITSSLETPGSVRIAVRDLAAAVKLEKKD